MREIQRKHQVDYVQHSGSDAMVVNAARVSHAGDVASLVAEVQRENRYIFGDAPTPDGARIIRYMAKNGHWTPFAHCHVTFRVTVPIFVANQLKRHRIGGEINEVSRRYVKDEPEFARVTWRKANPDPHIKQGSGLEYSVVDAEEIDKEYVYLLNQMNRLYYDFLNKWEMAGECARAILPMSMMTSWYWTGSIQFWANLCKLRIESHAQVETRLVARDISLCCHRLFPISWDAKANAYGFPIGGLEEDDGR